MKTEDAIRIAKVPQRLAGEPGLRQALERWLGDCDPARHGLPGEAIVLVRRLSTRWNAVLHPDPVQRYAPFAALLAGARRATTADANTDVVWFADEAELLACIARDALSGALSERWWWRSLRPSSFSGLPVSPALARWLHAPQQIPRSLQRLGEVQARAWITSWGDAGQALVMGELAQAYPLAAQVSAWVLEGRLPVRVAGLAQDPPPAAHAISPMLQPPVVAAARLQRLCENLVLHAGAASTLERLQALVAREEAPMARRADARSAVRHLRSDDEAQVPGTARFPAVARPEKAAEPLTTRRDAVAATQVAQPATAGSISPSRANAVEPAFKLAEPSTPAPHTTTSPAAPVQHADTPALLEAPPRVGLQTRHGGLLFLLNAALQLSLYGDFTMPRHRGLDCSPWRFLLLAGRAWCGPRFQHDPIAAWLRQRAPGARQPVPLRVWPELYARLAVALDDGQRGIKPRQCIRAMLNLPARLWDASERLDLRFALTELPLAVRLAGLDRDPGWIPAAGCDVRFHFD